MQLYDLRKKPMCGTCVWAVRMKDPCCNTTRAVVWIWWRLAIRAIQAGWSLRHLWVLHLVGLSVPLLKAAEDDTPTLTPWQVRF